MEMQLGQLVKSRKGRDVETLYVVIGLEKERAFLADGDKRTLAKPKEKNPRHLCPTKICFTKDETDTDVKIKTVLARHIKSQGLYQQGG